MFRSTPTPSESDVGDACACERLALAAKSAAAIATARSKLVFISTSIANGPEYASLLIRTLLQIRICSKPERSTNSQVRRVI